MNLQLRLRQSALSIGLFVVVLGTVAAFDERVRYHFGGLRPGIDTVTPWTDRLGEFVSVLVSALQYQSIDGAPLLIFATVGGVLFIFMAKS